LAECATGVIANYRDAVKVELLDEGRDQIRDPGRSQVRVAPHRQPMSAQREVRQNAPKRTRKRRYQVTPEASVCEQPMNKQERGTASGFAVQELALGQVNHALSLFVLVVHVLPSIMNLKPGSCIYPPSPDAQARGSARAGYGRVVLKVLSRS
jgi:hypothetical protein